MNSVGNISNLDYRRFNSRHFTCLQVRCFRKFRSDYWYILEMTTQVSYIKTFFLQCLCLGLNRIGLDGLIFDRFSSSKIQKVFWIHSEWLEMVRKQIPEWLGIALIRSERILIRYFRQRKVMFNREEAHEYPPNCIFPKIYITQIHVTELPFLKEFYISDLSHNIIY